MAWISRKTYEHLEEMLDAAIAEEFEESAYDESEMSRLETKWKRFLSASALSEDNVKKEHLAVQEMVSNISHQVKTPIANLRLYGEILQERLEGENKALAQRLMEQTELLDFLIQSLVRLLVWSPVRYRFFRRNSIFVRYWRQSSNGGKKSRKSEISGC